MVPVSILDVSKSYDGGKRVLDALNLEIAAGEMFFLLGSSGCGKTTLLRTIAGFIRPDQGRIAFAGVDVTNVPTEGRDIGMVFQNYALWPHLSVRQNVSFGLDLRTVAAVEKQRRVNEALDLVELGFASDRRIAQLSGGQQQRVALARALVVRPKVLLLDEPLSNLDARLRAQMRIEIRRVCKAAGVTALYVTHDQEEALSTADRIAILVDGRLAQVGTPREIYQQPRTRTVAEFIGKANIVPATVTGPDQVECALGRMRVAALPAGTRIGSAVLLCLRPELVSLRPLVGANTFSATLRTQNYLGERSSSILSCAAIELLVIEAPAPPRTPGDACTCSIAITDVIVLPP